MLIDSSLWFPYNFGCKTPPTCDDCHPNFKEGLNEFGPYYCKTCFKKNIEIKDTFILDTRKGQYNER